MKTFLVILLTLFVVNVNAQQPQGKDLKVGLVLSGGGAKGLAHIGVLKEIEAAGIKIDYIGGTSMGAIIGALYASGYTANQLDSIFKAVNFNKLIQDFLPRESQTLYEKNDAEKYAIALPFNNFKISFPSALSKGQNIYNLFSQLTEHVNDIHDFSKLPIPFFCIATDIEKGTAVVLDHGFLPQAITASGALPSLFSPVTVDGRLLIDGGVIDNYPVEELRARGANYIIGVDVQDDLRSRKELQSAPEILIQINNYRTITAMAEKARKTDIYIKPNIDNYTVVDFDKGDEIIAGGESKAKEFKKELDNLESRQKQFYIKPPLKNQANDSLDLKSVNITGNTYYTRSYVLGKLKINPPSKTTYKKLFSGINNLAATGNFERIDHHLEKYDDGRVHLELAVRESDITTYLRAGIHYDDLYKSAVLGNITKKRLIFKNDVASLDLILGDNIRYEFDYYSDNGFYISFGAKSSFNTFEKRVNTTFIRQISDLPLEGVNNLSIKYKDFTNQIYLQTLFERQFSLDLGLEHKYIGVETETISKANGDNYKFENSSFFSVFGKLRLDTFDNKYFPTHGWFFDGTFNLYALSSDYNDVFSQFSIGKAAIKYATTLAPKLSMLIESEGGFKIAGEDVNSLDFFLGGWGNNPLNNMVPFYGYDFISTGGDGFVKSTLTFDYNFHRKNHVNLGVNVANIDNKIFSTGNWFTAPDYTGYFLGYGLETFIGPLQSKIAYSPELKEATWYFSLGFWF
ncbi:MAG: patatin-like phospholipase family protein [Leeuwenhoekiella sp.]